MLNLLVLVLHLSAVFALANAFQATNRVPTKRWMAAGIGGACAVSIFLLLVSEPRNLLEDFRTAYYVAGASVLSGPEGFAELLMRGVDGFVNLPVVAYVFLVFAYLPKHIGEVVFTGVGVISCLAAWAIFVRAFRLDVRQAMFLLVLFVGNGPLYNSLKEGNTSHIVLVLLAAAILALRSRRNGMAGVLLGVAAVVKLPLLLLGVYFLIRKQWRAAAAGAAVCFGAVSVSVLVFGWDTHVLWYRLCIEPFGSNPMPAFNVQSIPSFFARLETGYAGLHQWEVYQLSHLSKALATIATGSLYLVAGVMFAKRRATLDHEYQDTVTTIEVLFVISLAVITSPLSWSHYYAWFLAAMAFLLSDDAARFAGKRSRLLWGGALGLTSLPVVDVSSGSWTIDQLYARLPSSYLLAGGLLTTMLLAKAYYSLATRKVADAPSTSSKV